MRHRFGGAVFGAQALPEPVGQVGLHRLRASVAVCADLTRAASAASLVLERPARQAEHADQRGDRERVRRGAARRRLQRALAPQHREHGLGDEGAVLLAEIAVAAKVGRQRLVRGARERQQFRERRLGVREQGRGRPHVRGLLHGDPRRDLVEARAVLVDDEDAHRKVLPVDGEPDLGRLVLADCPCA